MHRKQNRNRKGAGRIFPQSLWFGSKLIRTGPAANPTKLATDRHGSVRMRQTGNNPIDSLTYGSPLTTAIRRAWIMLISGIIRVLGGGLGHPFPIT
ncbi:MAG: hypothetical protein IT168_24775 [Bryobacterales bacterium]|nr:hypothetical protein [Bryobacterales bacterium]